MLGDFLTRCLVLLFGYAYPAFECYKTVEKNKVTIDELRFWCQYWVVVALLTVFERIGDIFISWLPMYGECKLAFIVYLWYPKTKGTGYIYEAMLRPLLAKHETDIDRKILELRARIWDFTLHYWDICTKMGATQFFQVLQYMAMQSSKFTTNSSEKHKKDENNTPAPPPSPSFRQPKKWTPNSPRATLMNRTASGRSNSIRNINTQSGDMIPEETDGAPESPYTPSEERLNQARMRLRRSNPIQS
ncbi:hypothetical protein ACFE04_030013 [Oxalis oulophora]